MTPETEQRIAATLAKTMAMLCVRNTQQETLHAGKTPATRTGDLSDVTVVDANGNRIPWTEVSHIPDAQMRDLMRDIVNRLYTFHLCADDPKLQATIERWKAVAEKWEEPKDRQTMFGQDGCHLRDSDTIRAETEPTSSSNTIARQRSLTTVCS